MKRIITAMALLLTLAMTPAHALSFDWGLTGGLNLTKLNLKSSAKSYFSSDNRAGWYLGVKANAGIALGLGVDASLLYSQQKFNLDAATNEALSTYDNAKTNRSICIPINLRYNIGIGSLASVYIATGPQFDFNVGSRNWNVFSTSSSDESTGIFRTENCSTSWNIGAGVRVLSHLEVGLGYNFGLSKMGETILNKTTDRELTTSETHANTFKVGVAYYF